MPARSARSASLRSLEKRLGGSFNLTVTAEKTEVGVPTPAGTDRYVDCMQLCPDDANGRDERNTRVRLAAQGLERIGRREVGLLARAAELHRRPPNALPGHKHAIRWEFSCVRAVILTYRRKPQEIDPARQFLRVCLTCPHARAFEVLESPLGLFKPCSRALWCSLHHMHILH